MDAATLAIIALTAALSGATLTLRRRGAALYRTQRQLAACQDEMRQVQSALLAQRRQAAALADAAEDALLIISSGRRVVAANAAARRAFGVGEAALGSSIIAFTRHYELETLAERALRGEDTPDEQVLHNDRTYRARALRADRDTIILALHDVTELLRLTRARRDMVANFSHDLRTPISSIRLLVDSLTLSYGRNAERDLRTIQRITSETDSLQHMTQELIDLSMIESGQAIMRMVPVPFAEVLRGTLALMETQIDQKRLEIVQEIEPNLLLLADLDQLRRVLSNIVHNAVKFTPAGGQIALSAAADDTFATIRVKDTGPGIPPHERARVFERFYQVDQSRTSPGKHGGTGLGLAIAKHIVEAHGGKIWAEGGIPTGACIAFTIPLAERQAALADAIAVAAN